MLEIPVRDQNGKNIILMICSNLMMDIPCRARVIIYQKGHNSLMYEYKTKNMFCSKDCYRYGCVVIFINIVILHFRCQAWR